MLALCGGSEDLRKLPSQVCRTSLPWLYCLHLTANYVLVDDEESPLHISDIPGIDVVFCEDYSPRDQVIYP